MTDIKEKVLEVRNMVVKKAVIFTAEDVDTSDTITLADLSTIDGSAVLDRSAGTTYTHTTTTNVITVSHAGLTDVDVIGIAIGDTA